MTTQTLRSRRKSRSRDEMKDLIVAAATELFSERGFDGPSIREIAAAADVAVPALYRIFIDKRDLYVKCCQLAYERHNNAMRSFFEADDPGEVILYKRTRAGFEFKLKPELNPGIDFRLLSRVALDMERDDVLLANVVENRNSDVIRKMLDALKEAGHDVPALRMMILSAVFLQMPVLLNTWPMLEVDADNIDDFTVAVLAAVCPEIDWARIAAQNRTVSPDN